MNDNIKKNKSLKKKFSNELGLVHIYTGYGKGKTTAALGLTFRALGHGFSVLFVQFMKGGRYFGELANAEKHYKKKLYFAQFGQSCPHSVNLRLGKLKCNDCRACFMTFEEEKEQAEKALNYAKKQIKTRKWDLVVLDEINNAINRKHLSIDDVLKLIVSKPKKMELVLTGRRAPTEIRAVADYITEMKKIRHPFDRNNKITGRRGVEY